MTTIYGDGFVADRMQPMPKSSQERQQAFRARKAILDGMTEVRGIYLPPELHAALKAAAAKLLAAQKKSAPSPKAEG